MARLALDVRALDQPYSSFARVVRLIQGAADAVDLELEPWRGGTCHSPWLWVPQPELPAVAPTQGLLVTIHDINPLLGGGRRLFARLRHAASFRRKVKRILRRANGIVTGTADAAQRLQQAFPELPTPFITPWYAGAEFRPEPEEGEGCPGGLASGYVLYLGALRPHKNWALALKAYAALAPSLRARHPLVMVGSRHRAAAEADRLAASLGIGDSLHWLSGLPDEALPALYRGAAAFLFPSLAEGFGLPPLEAQACGVPVLAACATSLPEVLGTGAMLLDPDEVEPWTAALAHLLSAPEAAADLRQAGLENAARWTAEGLGQSILEMLTVVEI